MTTLQYLIYRKIQITEWLEVVTVENFEKFVCYCQGPEFDLEYHILDDFITSTGCLKKYTKLIKRNLKLITPINNNYM